MARSLLTIGNRVGGLNHSRLALLVCFVAAGVALVSAFPIPRSWNDASRLATVESLVDYRTLAIDQSQFNWTGDKIWIDGHFYSHQSVVPALMLAGCYETLQRTTGLVAREQPFAFSRAMTVASSGLGYLIACGCVFAVAGIVGLSDWPRLLLVASFGLSTLALLYSQQVNSHMMLLGVASPVVLLVVVLGRSSSLEQIAERIPWLTLLATGTLGGLGYALDQGAGLLLLLCGLAYCLYTFRSFKAGLVVCLGAIPGIVVHHAVTYWYAGTWGPPAAVPEYFNWPGSTFTANDITGRWNHPTLIDFLGYSWVMLFGERGFLLHNLPLLLLLPAGLLLRRGGLWRKEIGFALAWMVSTYLMYAMLSINLAGYCISIRWFVPLLPAAYLVLAYALRRYPSWFGDLLILSVGGSVLCLLAWQDGPWVGKVPFAEGVQIATVGCWAAYRLWHGVQAIGLLGSAKSERLAIDPPDQRIPRPAA
jgi:hypothetical protein